MPGRAGGIIRSRQSLCSGATARGGLGENRSPLAGKPTDGGLSLPPCGEADRRSPTYRSSLAGETTGEARLITPPLRGSRPIHRSPLAGVSTGEARLITPPLRGSRRGAASSVGGIDVHAPLCHPPSPRLAALADALPPQGGKDEEAAEPSQVSLPPCGGADRPQAGRWGVDPRRSRGTRSVEGGLAPEGHRTSGGYSHRANMK